MKPFFIFALPRSGTTWLANFLTYGNSFCYHELLSESLNVDKMAETMESNGHKYVGNSDCGNYLFSRKIAEKYKYAKSIVVIRSPSKVSASLLRNGYTTTDDVDFYEESLTELRLIHSETDSIIVDFKDIFEEEHARIILEHVTDGEGVFNRERFEFLKNTNVQPENQYMKNKIERIRSMGMN